MPKFVRKYKKKAPKKAVTDKHILDVVHRDGRKFTIYKFRPVVRYDDNQMVPTPFLYNSTASDAFFNFNFSLDLVPQYTEYTDLYDQFCIRKVDVMFVPVSNTTMTTGGNVQISHLCTAIDLNDAVVPTSMIQMQAYDNFKVHGPNKTFKVSFRPAPAKLVYDGLTPSYALGTRADWLDCSNPTTPHYGLHVAITQGSAAYISQWSVWIRYHLEFRSAK